MNRRRGPGPRSVEPGRVLRIGALFGFAAGERDDLGMADDVSPHELREDGAVTPLTKREAAVYAVHLAVIARAYARALSPAERERVGQEIARALVQGHLVEGVRAGAVSGEKFLSTLGQLEHVGVSEATRAEALSDVLAAVPAPSMPGQVFELAPDSAYRAARHACSDIDPEPAA